VVSLSLEHRVLTLFTSFVAVDSEVTTGGDAKFIRVSTPLPEGLDYEGFIGGAPTGGVASLGGVSYMFAASAGSMARSNSLFSDYLEEDIDAEDVDAFALAEMATDKLATKIAKSTPDFASTEERIKWLARTQQVNGSWDDDIEMTAAAVLAFVRAGHTTRSGNYRQQLRKASMWLYQNIAQANGFPAFAALRALRELGDATGDSFVSDTIQQRLPAPVTDTERAAANDSALTIPAAITSLDDVRIAALLAGNAQVPAELRAQGKLVQVWMAVGKRV
jgi:hypothetical protein